MRVTILLRTTPVRAATSGASMPHVLRPLGHLAVVTALCAGVLVAVGGSLPASAADPADRALSRLHQDSDGALTVRGGDAGSLTFVGVPAVIA